MSGEEEKGLIQEVRQLTRDFLVFQGVMNKEIAPLTDIKKKQIEIEKRLADLEKWRYGLVVLGGAAVFVLEKIIVPLFK